jgi:Zn-dependent peptidase ImmA (M78 family)
MDLPRLAAHLRVTVYPADKILDGGIEALLKLHTTQHGCFSAVTISLLDGRRVVAYNSIDLDGQYIAPRAAKTHGRTRSNVAHEFAHIVLDHEVRSVQKIGEYSFFTCNPDQEAEANWLAGCLLLPRPLLLDAARSDQTDDQISLINHVSPEMARFRMNATGARMQIARMRKRRTNT